MISSEASAIIVTRGKRFGAQPLDTGGRKHVIIDVEHLQDPARDRGDSSRGVGRRHRSPGVCQCAQQHQGFGWGLRQQQRNLDRDPLQIWNACAGFCALQQMKRRGHTVVLVHYESPEWTTMKCGGMCSACRDHSRCLAKIDSILPPQHRGLILAPARPKAMPARPERDVRDSGAGDRQGEYVSVVDAV